MANAVIGSTSKADKPVACLLRSGDIVVMGRASRLSVHAVPRVLNDPVVFSQSENGSYRSAAEYLNTARININIRQVYK